jgi:hypothetical protein
MYYRLVLKDGLTLINMRHVREVLLRGPVITVHYPPVTDGRGLTGYGWKNCQQEYTYNNDESAKAEFEKIQSFVEKQRLS